MMNLKRAISTRALFDVKLCLKGHQLKARQPREFIKFSQVCKPHHRRLHHEEKGSEAVLIFIIAHSSARARFMNKFYKLGA
jgi:hypothetical protein